MIVATLNMSSANALNLDQSKNLLFGKELTLSQTTNLKLFKTHRLCRFDENGRKFFKWIENTVGKGEIAHNEQFSFFYSVFKRLILQTDVKHNPSVGQSCITSSSCQCNILWAAIQWCFKFYKILRIIPHPLSPSMFSKAFLTTMN